MGFTKAEKKRIENLLANPKLLNQDYKNCCGTIVIISGILEFYQKKKLIQKDFFKNLYTKIVHDINVSGSFNKVYKLGTRLNKRVDAGILKEDSGTSADIKLGIALLLMFKQHLKKINRKDVWDHCEKYSGKMVADWEHGKKIKKVGKGYTLEEMTYKNGDIAITQDAMRELLRMVSKVKNAIIKEVDLTHTTVMKYINEIRSYPNKEKMMIVMGVKIHSQADEMHQGGLVHWVYVPHSNYAIGNKELKVWTWGAEYKITDLKNLNLDTRKWGGVRSFAIQMV
jgi:hypothetical protein